MIRPSPWKNSSETLNHNQRPFHHRNENDIDLHGIILFLRFIGKTILIESNFCTF